MARPAAHTRATGRAEVMETGLLRRRTSGRRSGRSTADVRVAGLMAVKSFAVPWTGSGRPSRRHAAATASGSRTSARMLTIGFPDGPPRGGWNSGDGRHGETGLSLWPPPIGAGVRGFVCPPSRGLRPPSTINPRILMNIEGRCCLTSRPRPGPVIPYRPGVEHRRRLDGPVPVADAIILAVRRWAVLPRPPQPVPEGWQGGHRRVSLRVLPGHSGLMSRRESARATWAARSLVHPIDCHRPIARRMHRRGHRGRIQIPCWSIQRSFTPRARRSHAAIGRLRGPGGLDRPGTINPREEMASGRRCRESEQMDQGRCTSGLQDPELRSAPQTRPVGDAGGLIAEESDPSETRVA